MEAYDVVIAGGGPAGLAMAAPLAEAGLAVLVCERNAEIGLPVRTSGGSWPDDLRALGLPARLWHPISRLSFESQHSRCTIDWGGPVGCSLDVTATWRHLAELAAAAGATIENGTLVRLERTGALTLRHGGESRHVRCRLAVDATGTNALLARQSRVHEGFRRVGVGYEQELSAPAFGQDEAVILVGGLAPSGYAWAFPRGGTRVRVGVGLIQPDTDLNPRELYAPVERALATAGRCGAAGAAQRAHPQPGGAGAADRGWLDGGRRRGRALEPAAGRGHPARDRGGATGGAGGDCGAGQAGRGAAGAAAGLGAGRAPHAGAFVGTGDARKPVRGGHGRRRLGPRLRRRTAPAEMAHPDFRGDTLRDLCLAGAVARGPSSAWRVLRPFVRGGSRVVEPAESA
jgi:choline dehydrogenase-like flavoprotein